MVVRHSQVIKHGDKFQLSWLHTKRIMQNLCYISSSPARTAIERFWYLSFVKPGITCLQAKKHPAINLLNFVTDNDECAQNTHTCSLTSGVCKNTPGSFRCSCKPGFIGDGHNCEGLSICYRHLSNKLRCYRRISSPEKSRNSTREKISCYFFLTCVWYRQSAADTSLAFGATRSGWWKNGVQTFLEKGRMQNIERKTENYVFSGLGDGIFLAAQNENPQLEDLPQADYGRVSENFVHRKLCHGLFLSCFNAFFMLSLRTSALYDFNSEITDSFIFIHY